MGRSSKLTVVDVVWPGQMHQRGRRDRGQEVSQDTPETRRALGAQLTKRRHQLGLSQTALAAAAGVATGTIVSAERGKPVQPIKLAAITAALGADIETSDDTPPLLSSYFGESASNLRMVFDYCKNEPVVLLLDECDFIAKSRISTQDVGEVPRIVNMLLTLLDEYDAPGLVIATTNLKVSLDEALFRRFDDVIELPMPEKNERMRLLEMTLSAIPVAPDVNLEKVADQMDGYSSANIVLTAQRAAKIAVLSGNKKVSSEHFIKALGESSKF